ncbi:MAG: glycosyltransferase family 4 protein [Promethearchaeota archaeon]
MMNSYEILKHYDKKYNYDLILAYESGLSAHIGYLIKKKRDKKLILISHGNDILNKKLKVLTKLVLQEADKIIVRSNFMKNFVSSQYSLEASKIFICPDGVILKESDVQETKSELRIELKIDQREFIILSVGLLNLVRKGYDLILKSLKSLRDNYSLDINNIKYILIGRDNLKVRTWLKSLAKKYDLESNFEILVNLSNDLRNKYYKASDIFVMPSRDLKREGSVEGFGNVFIEAGYFSLPSVGSNTGGIPDAIESEKSGFIVNNFDELVEKIKLLYENKSLRLKMGQFAHVRVLKTFLWDKIYKLYMKTFKSII